MTDLLQCLFSQNRASVGSVRQEGTILYFLEDHGQMKVRKKSEKRGQVLTFKSISVYLRACP